MALAAKILVAQGQKIVNDNGFITVSDGVEVNVVRIAAEEQEAEPRLECIDGHDEENPDYPALLRPVCVAAKILIDLMARDEDGSPDAGPGDSLSGSVL